MHDGPSGERTRRASRFLFLLPFQRGTPFGRGSSGGEKSITIKEIISALQRRTLIITGEQLRSGRSRASFLVRSGKSFLRRSHLEDYALLMEEASVWVPGRTRTGAPPQSDECSHHRTLEFFNMLHFLNMFRS